MAFKVGLKRSGLCLDYEEYIDAPGGHLEGGAVNLSQGGLDVKLSSRSCVLGQSRPPVRNRGKLWNTIG